MTKMDLIRNLAEDFNFGELHIVSVRRKEPLRVHRKQPILVH